MWYPGWGDTGLLPVQNTAPQFWKQVANHPFCALFTLETSDTSRENQRYSWLCRIMRGWGAQTERGAGFGGLAGDRLWGLQSPRWESAAQLTAKPIRI